MPAYAEVRDPGRVSDAVGRVAQACPVAVDAWHSPATFPRGRLIQPDDVARAALCLAPDHAANVTGTMLNVDGGRGV